MSGGQNLVSRESQGDAPANNRNESITSGMSIGIGMTNIDRYDTVADEYREPQGDTECTERPEDPIIRHGKIRDISIKGLNFGFVVNIGCQNFAVETPEKLCTKLLEYLKSPNSIEKRWFSGEFNLNDETEARE